MTQTKEATNIMKRALIAFGAFLIFSGCVWILQGVNILPGSFMTGQMKWAYIGIVTALVGGALMWLGMRKQRR